MDENIISLIAKELNISISQVKNTLELLEEGATVPFIARYRKEVTGELQDEQLRTIEERMKNKFVSFKKIMRIK